MSAAKVEEGANEGEKNGKELLLFQIDAPPNRLPLAFLLGRKK